MGVDQWKENKPTFKFKSRIYLSSLWADAFHITWMHIAMLGALASALLKMGCCHRCSSWTFSTFPRPTPTKILERGGEMRVGGKSAKSTKLRNVFSLKQVCLKGLGRCRRERRYQKWSGSIAQWLHSATVQVLEEQRMEIHYICGAHIGWRQAGGCWRLYLAAGLANRSLSVS